MRVGGGGGRSEDGLAAFPSNSIAAGSYPSWKTWKVMEFKYFSFQTWKVIEFNCWARKIIVRVVRKLLQMSKQGQNKIQASCVRKYPKTRMILTIFEGGS